MGAGNAGTGVALVAAFYGSYKPYAPLCHNLRDGIASPNAVVCTRVRESALWNALVTAIRFLDGHPSSPETPIPVPPVTKSSTPAVRVGVGAVVRRAGDPSILLGMRKGSHGAGYTSHLISLMLAVCTIGFTSVAESGLCRAVI